MSAKPATRISWEVGLSAGTGGRMADPEPLWECLERFANTVVGPALKVDIHLLGESTDVLSHPYLNMLNGRHIVEAVRRRELEGYAAAMIAPAIDPALLESRASVDMPVVGSLEAALAASQFLGRQIGIVAVNPGYGTAIADAVVRYGLRDRLIAYRPIRVMPLSYPDIEAALNGDGEPLAQSITTHAEPLIADGADVIISGCQFYGPALWAAGITQWLPGGVPFVDNAAAGLALAAALVRLRDVVSLGKSTALHSPFRGADPALLANALSI